MLGLVAMSKRKAEDDGVDEGAAPGEAAAADDTSKPSAGKKGKYRREKPWDHDGIDHWKVRQDGRSSVQCHADTTLTSLSNLQPVEYTEEQGKNNPLIEETSFSTLFPKYREHYLRQVWPQVPIPTREWPNR